MYLKPADPDLQTLYQRMKSGDLDLQPEFQRGEVWGDIKRQRLIDSLLRDWQIPPVHVVVDEETSAQSVLDGQQRLAAIRDFFEGKLRINGRIEPSDPQIERLHGLSFMELPHEVRRKLERYSIRVFYISDYLPEEPGELFFRLNQNSALSPAEQRNAFFGRARRQVKSFVDLMENSNMQKSYFGFSNARMSYDDVVARALLLLESNSLTKKITSSNLVDKYRSDSGFSDDSIAWLEEGLRIMMDASSSLYTNIRLNKATALTWLVFSSRVARYCRNVKPSSYADFLSQFEIRRARGGQATDASAWSARAFAVYDDRASARVGDVASVVLRDFVLWLHLIEYVISTGKGEEFGPLANSEYSMKNFHEIQRGRDLESLAFSLSWGSSL